MIKRNENYFYLIFSAFIHNLPEVIYDVVYHIEHLGRDVVEGNGCIAATRSAIFLGNEGASIKSISKGNGKI